MKETFEISMVVSAVTATCLLVPAAAFSQTTNANSTTAEGSSGGLQTIVVTAQRREESLQEVPIAVTALGAAELEARNVTEPADLVKAVPSLTLTRANAFATPYLRGIGNSNSASGDEPSVATYVDGVYVGAAQVTVLPIYGIERVEVLKGPQGTLYGRNATGGLMNIITKKPGEQFEVEGDVGYGNYDTVRSNLYATGPITESVRASLSSVYVDQGKGFGRNLTNDERMGREEYYGLRGRINADLSDRIELDLSGDYIHHESDIYHIFGVFPGSIPLGSSVPGNDFTTAPREVYATPGYPGATVESYSFAGRFNVDLGRANFISTTSYRKVTTRNYVEADPNSIKGMLAYAQSNQSNSPLVEFPDPPAVLTVLPGSLSFNDNRNVPYFVTQEFQLQSSAPGPFDWIMGLYGQHNVEAWEPLEVNYIPDAANTLVTVRTRTSTKSYSGYAQGTYNLDNGLSFTAGARYTTEKKHTTGTSVFDGTQLGIGILSDSDDREKTFDASTWRLAVNYQVGEGVMVYGSASKGFKSGLLNPDAFRSAPVKPETLYAYEVGFKSDLASWLRLNGSVYYYDYENLQIFSNTSDRATGFPQNAGGARMIGGELELQALPLDNLNISASVGIEDAEYKDTKLLFLSAPSVSGGNIITPIDINGKTVVRTPKVSGNLSAIYDVLLGNSGALQFSGSLFYTSSIYFDVTNRLEQKAYALVDLGAKWISPDEKLSVGVWGKNVTNEDYLAFAIEQIRFDGATWAPPRTYGLTVGFNFR